MEETRGRIGARSEYDKGSRGQNETRKDGTKKANRDGNMNFNKRIKVCQIKPKKMGAKKYKVEQTNCMWIVFVVVVFVGLVFVGVVFVDRQTDGHCDL